MSERIVCVVGALLRQADRGCEHRSIWPAVEWTKGFSGGYRNGSPPRRIAALAERRSMLVSTGLNHPAGHASLPAPGRGTRPELRTRPTNERPWQLMLHRNKTVAVAFALTKRRISAVA